MKTGVLITGATGFVGRALCARMLQGSNARLWAAVNRMSPVGFPSGATPVVVGDIAKSSTVFKRLDQVGVVVHLAARAHVMHDELADPLTEYRRVNVQGTINVARQAAEAGVRRFVFISSVKVNGERTQPGHPFKPTDVPAPRDYYAQSKHEAEQALWQVARDTDMEVVVIRAPLVYGPGVKGNFALMVQWIRSGIPLPLGAVHNRRSMVALDNLVDFIALCADQERCKGAANRTFFVSDGDDVSTSELLRRLAHAYGVQARLVPVPVGLMRSAARLLGKAAVADRLLGSLQVDASNTLSLLGWIPPVSMDEQLRKMAVLATHQ